MKSVQVRSFSCSVFSCIQTEYGHVLRKSLYSVRIQENTDQKKLRIWTLSGHLSHSVHVYSENKLTSIFDNYFITITSDLKLKNPPTKKANGNLNDPLEKFSSQSSVKEIRDCFRTNYVFNFTSATSDKVRKKLLHLDGSEATMYGDVPTDISKRNIEVYLNLITEIIDKSFCEHSHKK